MQIFKGPRKAVLNRSRLNKAILISMNQFCNQRLEPIGKELCDDFHRKIKQRYRSILIYSDWPINFRDEDYEGAIDAPKTNISKEKSITKIIEILLDQRPTFFQELIVETIRARRFVHRELLDYIVNFLGAKRYFKRVQINGVGKERVQIKLHTLKVGGA